MLKIKSPVRSIFHGSIFLFYALLSSTAVAHNGVSALAYPVKNIKVDGDLSDWVSVKKYPLALTPSDVKPTSGNDFSAFFMIGYNLVDKSMYAGIEITDSDYISDTTRQVSWNTQDGIQLYFDIRHLAVGSGVVSYLYSETRKNIDSNKWDVGSKGASWNTVEVKMKRNGIRRIYEWKVYIGDALQPGRTIGFDITAFDKDTDGFGWNEWGPGGSKYQDSNALSDIILMKEKEAAGVVNGSAEMKNVSEGKSSAHLKFTSTTSPQLWVTTVIDSLGKYSLMLPEGIYSVDLSEKYIAEEKKVYEISTSSIANVRVRANASVNIPPVNITVSEAPDLIPDKGILLSFNSKSPAAIDKIIETYQKYYKIPGVSLALIKDGKVVYHKVYGVKNSFTKEPVNDSTLFEAASITKPVFSYAVQRLAERGVIDLDKPLYQYLPFKDIEYDDRYKLITGRHVLTHRTGFPNWREGKLVINFTPGTQYSYSGEGMQYLQAVIEKITGKGIEQVIKEEVLDPLGMHHTFFSNNERLMKLVSTGHFNNVPSSDDPPSQPGMAYSMHTEALEFTKFMIQLMEQKGLSASTYENMLSERSPFIYKDGDEKPRYKEYMGESLAVRDSPFGQVFGHGGNNGDFRCQFEVYKDSKTGYAIFTNSSTAYPLLDRMKLFLMEGKD